MFGIGGLKPHSALAQKDLVTVNVVNKISYGPGRHTIKTNPKRFEVTLFGNQTVWRLKQLVAEKLNIHPKYIILERMTSSMGPEIKESHNAKTLSELEISDTETLNITKKQETLFIHKIGYLFKDKDLTPESLNMFKEWFALYSENGEMNRENCAAFTSLCTNQNVQINDRRVDNLFTLHDP